MLLGLITSSCQAIHPVRAIDGTPRVSNVKNDREAIVSARVTRVVSGQSIEVQLHGSNQTLNQTIRLIGVQSPAYGQEPWGADAQNYLEDLLLGQTIQLSFSDRGHRNNGKEVDSSDPYERQWAYVWLDGQLVNLTLIAEGVVLEDGQSPYIDYAQQFAHAQHRARVLGLGIWNPNQPLRQTPYEFWQQKK
ncbi:MAG: thermonuclease family protein [Cyanobacteria bacterium P01_F01_bin.150]